MGKANAEGRESRGGEGLFMDVEKATRGRGANTTTEVMKCKTYT